MIDSIDSEPRRPGSNPSSATYTQWDQACVRTRPVSVSSPVNGDNDDPYLTRL